MPASPPDAGGVALTLLGAYRGPSPWSDEPAVLAAIDIGAGPLAGGTARCARLAGVGGIDAPPLDGTSDTALEVAAFLAQWSLALLNREGGCLQTARAFREGPQLRICLGCHHERASLAALGLAADLLRRADRASDSEVQSELAAFARLARQHHPDYQARILMIGARAAEIPWLPWFPGHRLWQFGWGRNGQLFFESQPKADSAIGWKVARDKTATKAVVTSLGVRMAPHALARSEADLPAAAEAVGWPCVVKPAASGRSRGVTADVDDLDKLQAAFRRARDLDKGHVMIERQVEGEVYRIMVVRGRTVCVIRRSAPSVLGDGRRSVRELIEAANAATAPLRARWPELVGPIPFDDELDTQLAKRGWTPDTVVPAGETIVLRRIPLLETGAVYCDVTDQAHPDILRMSELIAESLGLAISGIDFISGDITRSCAEEGTVLEVNTTPGLRVPLIAGWTEEAVGRLALGDAVGRIRVTLVLGGDREVAEVADGLRLADGHAWVIGNRCGLGPLPLAGTEEEPRPGRLAALVSRMLRNPLSAELTIVCRPDALAETGIPVDRFAAVVACPCELDQAWRTLLARQAERWHNVADAREALALLSRPR